MGYPAYGSQWPPPGGAGGGNQAAGTPIESKAYKWFVVYVVAMVLLYVVCTVGGAFALFYDFDVTDSEAEEIKVQAGIFMVVGFAMLVVFAIGLFLPRRPWAWVYGLILLGLGLTSCCTWPITIPLLIQWLKPEMKARFGQR
jgi:hypothetical protein